MHLAYGRGLGLGLGASVMLAAGLAMMKSRGEALPAAQGTRMVGAVVRWVRDPLWAGGLVCECGGYALYFAALAQAPVSLIAVMMQAGIAVFVIIAIIFLRERASAVEAVGIFGIIVGMVLLTLSLRNGAPHSTIHSTALAALSGGCLIPAAVPWSAPRLRHNGVAPAIASGIAFGLGGLYTKALADIFAVHTGSAIAIQIALSPWLYLMIGANLAGLVALQNAFHWTRGIIAMPLSSAISNLVPIVGGIIAFGERLPAEPTSAALRMAAFTLTILAGILIGGGETSHASSRPASSKSARTSGMR